jgi:hypothetical protein
VQSRKVDGGRGRGEGKECMILQWFIINIGAFIVVDIAVGHVEITSIQSRRDTS